MKSNVKPSIGRVVIYVWGDDPQDKVDHNNHADVSPAIVVRTWGNTAYENDEVNLRILADGQSVQWKTSVPYSETKEPNTWHWPERN